MRVISKKKLQDFWARFPDSKAALQAWYAEAKTAAWKNPAEIKEKYGNASILKNSRMVFNICGNKYRLVVQISHDHRQSRWLD